VTDFDPNVEPQTHEQADAYLNWCAENFVRLSMSEPRTYRNAIRCAAWLLVVATAQFHLDEDVEQDREALLEQIALYSRLARAIERQRDHIPIERLIVSRSTMDCWEPVGAYADHLLCAAKDALAALMLIETHPLLNLWDVECPDVWALLDHGADVLACINDADELTYADYAIRRNDAVVAQFTWQRANNLSRGMGGYPLSPN
jgi:hypothetical protein